MNTFQRAGAAVGLSLAVGTGAYVAERIFEPVGVDYTNIAEQYQACATIPQEEIHTQCVEELDNSINPLTWLGILQLGSIGTGIAGVVVAYRNVGRQE